MDDYASGVQCAAHGFYKIGSPPFATRYRVSTIGGKPSGTRRFEAKWLREENFRSVVEKAWEDAGTATSSGVLAKLGHMHEALHAWDSSVLQKLKRRLWQAKKEMEKALSGPMSDENEIIAKEQAKQIEILLEQEEVH